MLMYHHPLGRQLAGEGLESASYDLQRIQVPGIDADQDLLAASRAFGDDLARANQIFLVECLEQYEHAQHRCTVEKLYDPTVIEQPQNYEYASRAQRTGLHDLVGVDDEVFHGER